jgi:hypothetical protein
MLAAYVPPLPLRRLFEDDRFVCLDKLEQYYRGTQYDGRPYDWSGAFRGFGDTLAGAVMPGYYVPLAQRRPSARFDIGKVIVQRLSSFLFGESLRPSIVVAGDPDAEDYVRELARVSNLWARLRQARNKGGTCGTAVLSWSLKNGKPTIAVQNPKHVRVLSWSDEDELRPRVVLKAYSYCDELLDAESKAATVRWSIRLWTDEIEARWRDVPNELAESGAWRDLPPSIVVRHGFGFCPVYWIQNQPEEEDHDGTGDFEGAEDLIDEMNATLSQTTRGTKANVDPTLVIHDDAVAPGRNDSGKVVQKGSGNVIWSKGGAEYLELSGQAVDAGLKTFAELERLICDQCGVVRTSAEKLSGAAQSARALEILYAPTLATAATLREQYGEHGAIPILLDMLRVARKLESAEPRLDAEGRSYVEKIILDPRLERVEDEAEGDEDGEDDDDGVPVMVEVERTPGTSEAIVLSWPPYFAPTWSDRKEAVAAAKEANGGKPVISHRTSVALVASLFGIADVDEELAQIEREQAAAVELAREAFGGDPTGAAAFGNEPDPADEPEDEDGDE